MGYATDIKRLRYIGVCWGIVPKKGKGKVKTSVALDPEIVAWIDKLVQKKRFADRTHAIALALQRLKESGYGES